MIFQPWSLLIIIFHLKQKKHDHLLLVTPTSPNPQHPTHPSHVPARAIPARSSLIFQLAPQDGTRLSQVKQTHLTQDEGKTVQLAGKVGLGYLQFLQIHTPNCRRHHRPIPGANQLSSFKSPAHRMRRTILGIETEGRNHRGSRLLLNCFLQCFHQEATAREGKGHVSLHRLEENQGRSYFRY